MQAFWYSLAVVFRNRHLQLRRQFLPRHLSHGGWASVQEMLCRGEMRDDRGVFSVPACVCVCDDTETSLCFGICLVSMRVES